VKMTVFGYHELISQVKLASGREQSLMECSARGPTSLQTRQYKDLPQISRIFFVQDYHKACRFPEVSWHSVYSPPIVLPKAIPSMCQFNLAQVVLATHTQSSDILPPCHYIARKMTLGLSAHPISLEPLELQRKRVFLG